MLLWQFIQLYLTSFLLLSISLYVLNFLFEKKNENFSGYESRKIDRLHSNFHIFFKVFIFSRSIFLKYFLEKNPMFTETLHDFFLLDQQNWIKIKIKIKINSLPFHNVWHKKRKKISICIMCKRFNSIVIYTCTHICIRRVLFLYLFQFNSWEGISRYLIELKSAHTHTQTRNWVNWHRILQN